MDLRAFYQQMRSIEQDIQEPHVVVISRVTPDGGKAGVKTEVTREIAARMIAEGRCHLASPEETYEFRAAQQAAMDQREKSVLTNRLNVNFLTDQQLAALREPLGRREN